MIRSQQPNASYGMENAFSLPEPIPDWIIAKVRWRNVWPTHTIGFGFTFAIIDIYIIVMFVTLRRRVAAQPLVLLAGACLVLATTCRSFYLLVDPYESCDVLHILLLRLLYVVVSPALLTSFNLQQTALFRLTKSSHAPPRDKRKHSAVISFIAFYFFIVIVIEIFIVFNSNLRLFRFLPKSLFIVWTLISCFSFVYNGFKVAQFTKEANQILKQFAEYSRAKSITSTTNGCWKDLALHQIKRSKLLCRKDEISLDYRSTSAASSSSSSSSSSDSDLYINELALNSRRQSARGDTMIPMFAKPMQLCASEAVNTKKLANSTAVDEDLKEDKSDSEPVDSGDGGGSTEEEKEIGLRITGNGTNGISVISTQYIRKGMSSSLMRKSPAAKQRCVSYHNASYVSSFYALSELQSKARQSPVTRQQQEHVKANAAAAAAAVADNAAGNNDGASSRDNCMKRIVRTVTGAKTHLVRNNAAAIADYDAELLSNQSRDAATALCRQRIISHVVGRVDSLDESTDDDKGVVVKEMDDNNKDTGYSADTEPCVSRDTLYPPEVALLASQVADSPLHQPFQLRPSPCYIGLSRIKRGPQIRKVCARIYVLHLSKEQACTCITKHTSAHTLYKFILHSVYSFRNSFTYSRINEFCCI